MMAMERRALLRLAALAPALALPAACDTPPRRSNFPELTYQHLPKLRFDVRRVEVVEAYQSPGRPPNVEHLFPVRPLAAATNWARDRLVAAGAARSLRYIVREASVVEESLPIDEGLKGALEVQQSERYDLRLIVELQILGEDRAAEGTATVKATRSVTVPEDITLHQRERVWFHLTEQAMNDLNAQLEKTLPSVFARYLLP